MTLTMIGVTFLYQVNIFLLLQIAGLYLLLAFQRLVKVSVILKYLKLTFSQW
jgi:hypothetical protein